MSARTAVLALVLASWSGVAQAATYTNYRNFTGSSFFSGFSFVTGYDNTTTGDVVYAQNSSLAYVDTSGNAIMRVAQDFVPYNEKRNSVKIQSQEGYGLGSLMVLDATHVPYGCSVWPAWYTVGYGVTWPTGGEIDIIEMQNRAQYNQLSLHTAGTCSQPTSVTQTGRQGSTDCAVGTTNTGCTVQTTNANSYGAGFNANGGGVYALEFASTGINMWFFPRASIPSDISSGSTSVDPTTWGTATASYPASSCSMGNFAAQQMILTTTLCGQWAGIPSVYSQTCGTGTANASSCYLENVINAGDYAQAYWSIRSLRVYSNGTPNVTGTISSSAATTTQQAGGGAQGGSSGSLNAGSSSPSGSTRASSAAQTLAPAFAAVGALALALLTLA